MKELINGEKKDSVPRLIYPPEAFVFDTHTDIQNEFMDRINRYGIDAAIDWLDGVKANTERSYPKTLTFSWENIFSSEYIFELSKNENFADVYKIRCTEPCCDINNLEVGEKYFWRVNGGKPNSFSTKNNYLRFIKIDGLLNVRDIGGNKIKQGLVYRGSDLCTYYKITEYGKHVFCELLKIKTEVELRKERCDATESDVGKHIKYKYLPYRPYEELFEEEHRRGICDIMEFLSHEENYPMYIHCLGGADRTGMIAIFLRALVGECDEFIHMDYELTSLSTYAYGLAEGVREKGYRSRNSDYYKKFLDLLNVYAPGKTLHEKVKVFLLDCGVENECLEKIVKIISK